MLLLTIIILTNAIKYSDNYMQSIEVIQNDPDHLALILMIKSNHNTSDTALSIIQEYQKEIDDIVNIVVINCSNIDQNELIHLPGCQNEEYLPFAMYLIPPTTFDDPKNIRPKEKLLPGLSLNLLRTEFQNNSPRFWITLTNREEYEQWLKNTKMNKVLTSIQQPPLWWFGITQKYRDRLDFAIIDPSIQSEDLLILKFVNNQYETQKYNGPRRYESLRAFLSKFARQSRITLELGLKQEEKIIKKIQKINEIDHHNQWVLLHYSNGQQNQKYNQIVNDMGPLFQIYEIEDQYQKQQLLIFPFSSNNNPIQIRNHNIQQICISLLDQIPNKLITSTHELLNQISQLIVTKKILITLFQKKQQINQCFLLWAQTLANKQQFKDFIQFYSIIDPDESLQKQYSITKYPQLSSLQIDNGTISQANYNNYFTYQGLEDFLITVIHQKNQTDDKLQIVHNQQEFDFFCQQGKKCIIGLIDLSNEADQDALLKAMKSDHYHNIWILIDSRCQSLLISKYKLNPPQLLIYDMNNYQLSIMPQKLSIRNIGLFLKQKNKKWREIDFEIEIQKCNLRDDL